MAARDSVVYSSNGTAALVEGHGSRKVLRLAIPSDATQDSYPNNLKANSTASRKPGDNIEWFVPGSSGDKADLLYRTKVADAIVESLGVPVKDDIYAGWILDRLPTGYQIFVLQKGEVENTGIDQIKRSDTYLYGHPNGARFRSPNEYAPHLISLLHRHQNSILGLPRNTSIPYEPLNSCSCAYCPGPRRNKLAPSSSNLAGPSSSSPSAAMDTGTSRARLMRNTAVQANNLTAMTEAERDIKDGGWKFRKGEVIWAFIQSETAALGGTWIAALVVNAPETASFADFANIFTSMDRNRGFYRVQKCGSDTAVHLIHLSQILPWVKEPQPDEAGNITVDEASKAAAQDACQSYFIVARDPKEVTEFHEKNKTLYELKGIFLGPEKIWPGDAVRIPRKEGFAPDISIWDPKQYDLLVVRRIVLMTVRIPEIDFSNEVSRTFTFYLVGDVITMYPRDTDKILENMDRTVPNYIKNIGPDSPKWLARAAPDGIQLPASVSGRYVLGRFYDPRIIALMDGRWSASDSVVSLNRHMEGRAAAVGIHTLNGEPIRGRNGHHVYRLAPTPSIVEGEDDAEGEEPTFTGEVSGNPLVSEQERASLIESSEALSLEDMEEYRRRSGNIAPPKNPEEQRDRFSKKRRVD
ncbi:hypothetical protein H072_4406 [Dactylellina haptotyla CBS 200.50]|uniref:Cryptic loci regulator 2 N-terminal domain-containing protein n=1 Tax=Dactylellina haptotyla (strain CBS 200.50) TaxID=1284197 RepID=S8C252_DACHA|nr:hypothetical protein H072_4406 [Dactylellina haptotyla CBS 200.50]